MNRKKISAKSFIIYSLLLLIGLGYVLYILLISDLQNKLNTAQTEVKELNTQVAELEMHILNKEKNLKLIEENNIIIKDDINRYKNSISQEDLIEYLSRAEDDNFLIAPTASFGDTETFESINYSYAEDKLNIECATRSMSIAYNVGYKDLKEFLSDLLNSDLRPALDNIVLSLDNSTNLITGTMLIHTRTINSSDYNKDYYNTDSIRTGVNNLFGNYRDNSYSTSNIDIVDDSDWGNDYSDVTVEEDSDTTETNTETDTVDTTENENRENNRDNDASLENRDNNDTDEDEVSFEVGIEN